MIRVCFLVATIQTGCVTLIRGDSNVISIRSEVKEARLYLDDKYLGREFANEIDIDLKKNKKIYARRAGCRTASRNLEVKKAWGWFILGNFLTLPYGYIVDAINGIELLARKTYVINPRCTHVHERDY